MAKTFSVSSPDDETQDNQYSEHTGRNFCYDSTCPDKQDQAAINQVNGWLQDGLISQDDAERIREGRIV